MMNRETFFAIIESNPTLKLCFASYAGKFVMPEYDGGFDFCAPILNNGEPDYTNVMELLVKHVKNSNDVIFNDLKSQYDAKVARLIAARLRQ